MTIPWLDLGLSRFRAVDTRGALDFHNGDPADRDVRGAADPILLRYGESDRPAINEIDLRLFARVLRPTLPDHRMQTVCDALGVHTAGRRHAVVLRDLFAAQIGEAVRLDPETLDLLGRLLPGRLSDLLSRLTIHAAPPEPAPAPPTGRPAPASGTVAELLGPDGPIAGDLPAYEPRTGQLETAERIDAVFESGGTLAVEAGPGTGKTFAYLVPAIVRHVRGGAGRTVISTRTKGLQEQIYRKDLPFLLSLLAPDLRTALLKGRVNYLCLRRWRAVIEESVGSLDRDRSSMLAPLVRWIAETKTGDIEENTSFLSHPQARRQWEDLCDSPLHCSGSSCLEAEDCFSIQARRRARRADLVIVNHPLLLADLATGGQILGRYAVLIVDEAHALESSARAAFTRTFSSRRIQRFADGLSSPRTRSPGWLRRLSVPEDDPDVRRIVELTNALPHRTDTLIAALRPTLDSELRTPLPPLRRFTSAYEPILALLGGLEATLEALSARIDDLEAAREADGHIAETRALRDLLESLGRPPGKSSVHWAERLGGDLSLHASPLDVSPFFVDHLYPHLFALILTSATLSCGGDFGYLSRSLGLSSLSDVQTFVAPGSFDHERRMRIYVPKAFPSVGGDESAYTDAVAGLLVALVDGLRRKGLVLFTSHRMLRGVAARLPERTPALAQGLDGPAAHIAARFRRARGGVLLLGTDSFWEGVDFPGEELEFLVIPRLPFSVPADPVFSALAEQARADSRDPFLDLALPQAILRLQQGVGRLIRRQSDRGAVVITDTRLISRPYGKAFASSLPAPIRTDLPADELVDELVRWFAPPSENAEATAAN